MPHSGHIKRFVLEDTGFKFYSDETDAFIFHIKTIGHYIPIPLFTLVLIKRNGEVIDLGTFNIIWSKTDPQNYKWEYSLTSNLGVYLEEYKINMKDILNIRSEIDTSRKSEFKAIFHD